MRAIAALLLPLLLVLGVIAWGATEAVERTSRRWFERDMRARAEILVQGVKDPLSAALRRDERTRARKIVGDLARDERVTAAAVCDAGGALVASTPGRPESIGCRSVRARGPGEGATPYPWSFEALGANGPMHVTAIPISDEEGPLGFAVVLEDMAWVFRREVQTRWFLWIAFGVVSVAAAVATTLAVRFSWRSWTREMRRVLWGALPLSGSVGTPPPRPARHFQPLLSDVRALVADLVAEQVEGRAGLWGPERLRDALAKHLPGSEVIVVANREPFSHERGPDGQLHVMHPASGLVHRARAGHGGLLRHLDRARQRRRRPGGGRSARADPGPARQPDLHAAPDLALARGGAGVLLRVLQRGPVALCHQAHTRPVFRGEDWTHYREVNRRFAEAVVEEAAGRGSGGPGPGLPLRAAAADGARAAAAGHHRDLLAHPLAGRRAVRHLPVRRRSSWKGCSARASSASTSRRTATTSSNASTDRWRPGSIARPRAWCWGARRR